MSLSGALFSLLDEKRKKTQEKKGKERKEQKEKNLTKEKTTIEHDFLSFFLVIFFF